MSKRKLFIVEDDPMFAEMLKDFLKSRPQWEVNHFTTGEACVKEAYQDPTSDDPNWVCVDVAPVKKLKKEVSLDDVKSHPGLANMDLVRLGRLSVQTVTKEQYDEIIKMSNEK